MAQQDDNDRDAGNAHFEPQLKCCVMRVQGHRRGKGRHHLLATGQTADAREALSNAVLQLERSTKLLDREDPIITRHLGDAYRSMSRFPDALEAYRRALGLDPKESFAEEIRREIQLLELQLQGASPEAQP